MLRELEPLSEQVDERRVDVVDTAAQRAKFVSARNIVSSLGHDSSVTRDGHPSALEVTTGTPYSVAMTTDARSTRTWRDSALTRVLGSAFGWFAGALALTLLYQAVSELAALGGFCARGGPFEIAVECTDAIVVFAPTSIVGGLAAVFLGALLAQGFGTLVLAFAWPALFSSLAVVFLRTFFVSGDPTGLLIGIMFVLMGLTPLVVGLRAAPQRVLLGRVDAQGRPFWEAHPARAHLLSLRRPPEPGENHPSIGDWMLSLGIAIVASAGGIALGVVWFTAVATSAGA